MLGVAVSSTRAAQCQQEPTFLAWAQSTLLSMLRLNCAGWMLDTLTGAPLVLPGAGLLLDPDPSYVSKVASGKNRALLEELQRIERM
jgi:hypothetical protein